MANEDESANNPVVDLDEWHLVLKVPARMPADQARRLSARLRRSLQRWIKRVEKQESDSAVVLVLDG